MYLKAVENLGGGKPTQGHTWLFFEATKSTEYSVFTVFVL